jgi:S-formylglutathione hydrolase FrmB
MNTMMKTSIALAAVLVLSSVAHAEVSFQVTFDASTRAQPATGRLLVYLVRPDARLSSRHEPASELVMHDPQPIYGVSVKDLKPGEKAIVDDSATWCGLKLDSLPPGKYRMQSVLDMHQLNSEWSREAGNLYSDVGTFEVKPGNPSLVVEIKLNRVVKAPEFPEVDGAEEFVIRSELLSAFHKRDVYLRAGVAFPANFDTSRKYAAVYEVPGYGGDHSSAARGDGRSRTAANADDPRQVLRQNTFYIVLDPESPNGHTLFCDSDNNGPYGRALTEELIPALEKKYNLIAQPSARILRGHSSGGWSTIWLGMTYPDVFGAVFSSAPDPVDFRRFELVHIYNTDNFYVADGKDIPSARFGGRVTLTVRQENAMEHVLDPNNNSSQQWDSWQACWGTRQSDGSITPLFDPITGAIDKTEAETYRRFDIVHLLKSQPQKYAAVFRQNIRVVCGEADTYYLEEAVKLLKEEFDRLPGNGTGYVKVVPRYDHSSIYASRELQAFRQEMVDHLKLHGHIPSKQSDESGKPPAKKD